jgi:UDPglucose 6-dehydrogenase
MRGMRLTVIGAGYVGVVTAACLARMGHRVAVLELSEERVAALSEGRAPFFEPGLDKIVAAEVAAGRLTATTEPVAALHDAQLVLVCVGTPLSDDGQADLGQVEDACRAIAETDGVLPVAVRSTLPLGSTARLAGWLGRRDTSDVVTNPEFLRQGNAVADFESPARVVIGTRDGSPTPAADLVRQLYEPLNAPILVTDYASAEVIKNAANAFLAVRLSFINEVADLCEAYGADIEQVAHGIGLDPRIGTQYLRPGIGFGGSCLPKELANLVRLGRRGGLAMPLLDGVGRANDGRPTRIADRLDALIGPLRGQRVAILGLAFKPGTDDVRYSPAVALAHRMVERGARVVAHDPVVPAEAPLGEPTIERVESTEAAVAGACLVILATEWSEYREAPWAELARIAARPTIFDGRNALDHKLLAAAGWRVISVGREPTADVE